MSGHVTTRAPRAKKCVVCMEQPRDGLLFCSPCRRAYDRALDSDVTVASVVRFAAARARAAERRRWFRKLEAARFNAELNAALNDNGVQP